MNNTKKTKIVCTIGPASWDPEVMRRMIEAGMNCARVNGAFADPDELDKVAGLVRAVNNKVSLMLDVKGPEVRMNKFPEPIAIKPGDTIVIGNDSNENIYPSNYENLYTYLTPGQKIMIGDGDVEMEITEIKDTKMYCTVLFGEQLKPGKAMNLPGAKYTTEVLTEKDKVNLRHAIDTQWDFVCASFIQDGPSAEYIKSFIGDSQMKLIAKIENQSGLDNLDDILKIVDGVMVARGGLGIELGLEKVPMAQKLIIEKATEVGKPVITATQMLESMTENPKPTRAETNDVATAIIAGTDAVMLSGESSAGKYPVEAVQFLTTMANEIEDKKETRIIEHRATGATITADSLAKAAAELCNDAVSEVSKVIVISEKGTLARLIGRHNIKQPIYAFVCNHFYLRTLMLSKGIFDAFIFEGLKPEEIDRDLAINQIKQMALENNIVQKGDKVLFVGKSPKNTNRYFPNIFEIIKI